MITTTGHADCQEGRRRNLQAISECQKMSTLIKIPRENDPTRVKPKM